MEDAVNLYTKMIEAKTKFRNAYVELYNTIGAFFEVYDESEKEDESTFKIMFDEYDTLIVRSVVEIKPEILDEFYEKFNTKLLYKKQEALTNYQTPVAVDARIVEYGFMFNEGKSDG